MLADFPAVAVAGGWSLMSNMLQQREFGHHVEVADAFCEDFAKREKTLAMGRQPQRKEIMI